MSFVQNTHLEKVKQQLQPNILRITQYQGEVSITISRELLYSTLKQLKDEFGFTYLVDIGTTDHYTDEGRFEVFYNLFNIKERARVRVKCRLEEDQPEVQSAVDIWPGAAWHEREAYDMMGIRFAGNPDLRRIYMPEDFQYFPHRKEFPLIGIPGSLQMPEKDPPKGYR